MKKSPFFRKKKGNIMKKNKIIFIMIVMSLLLACLSACSDKNETVNPDTGNIETVYENHEDDIKERDEEGNLILTSTEYRRVYLTEPGTYVVLYTGNSGLSRIMVVKDFKTTEAAVEYAKNNSKALTESGDYANFNLDGKYVTYSPTLSNEKYGKYFSMSLKDLTEAFSVYELQ